MPKNAKEDPFKKEVLGFALAFLFKLNLWQPCPFKIKEVRIVNLLNKGADFAKVDILDEDAERNAVFHLGLNKIRGVDNWEQVVSTRLIHEYCHLVYHDLSNALVNCGIPQALADQFEDLAAQCTEGISRGIFETINIVRVEDFIQSPDSGLKQ